MQDTHNIKTNVSTLERVAATAIGAYLIYKASSEKNTNLGKMTAGVGLLLRGISGYCPIYDAVHHLKK